MKLENDSGLDWTIYSKDNPNDSLVFFEHLDRDKIYVQIKKNNHVTYSIKLDYDNLEELQIVISKLQIKLKES